MSARLMILGLDGASWRLTQKLVEEGRMPNLGRMMREGAAGPLYSTMPYISPTAWASFMTGKNPGEHGVYGFGLKIPGTYFVEPFSSRGRAPGETLWGLLSSRGRRVAVLNVPMTYPPTPVNGVMIAGFGAPDEKDGRLAYPPGLMKELRTRLGPYILDVEWLKYETHGLEALIEAAREMVRCRTTYALEILGRETWDLFAVVFVATDRVQHCAWQYLDPAGPLPPAAQRLRNLVLDFYDHLDGVLGQLMAASPQATVLVMSDHGFGPHVAEVHLNTWLVQEGFLTWETRQANHYDWLTKLAKRLGLTRKRLRGLLRLGGMDEYAVLERFSERGSQICWSRTRAFSYGHSGIYLNLKGRERSGIVEPGAEAEWLLEELRRRLLKLRDPLTGQCIVRRVTRSGEVYHGSRAGLAPDLVIAECDPRYMMGFRFSPTEQLFERPTWRSGGHHPEGLLVAHGPQVAKAKRMERADLVDLFSTALLLLAEPVPDDLDGRPLTELLAKPQQVLTAPARSESPPADSAEGMSLEEQEKVFQRLKGLGYLE